MADIYDTTVTHMKIGVAVPIVNPSFKFWDDPNTWSVPNGWTKANLTVGRYWTGYDGDQASLKLSAASIPDDYSYKIQSAPCRFWYDYHVLNTAQDFYWSLAGQATISGGGANVGAAIQLRTADTVGMTGSLTSSTLKSFTTTSAAELVRFTGTANHNPSAGNEFADILMFLRDATVIFVYWDCIGVMFNPIDASGYYQLTNVFPANGPQFWYEKMGQLIKTPLGTHKRHDPSGGAEKIKLSLQFINEDITTYETLKYFHQLNWGTPGLPGLPLALEPNLPGLPPMLVVNWMDNDFPLTRDTTKAERYSGTCNFETMW